MRVLFVLFLIGALFWMGCGDEVANPMQVEPGVLTAYELVDRWDGLVGKTVTVLVPGSSLFDGATVTYPVAGLANLYFHFPVRALEAVERLAANGFIEQKIYVRGVVKAGESRRLLHIGSCQLVSE